MDKPIPDYCGWIEVPEDKPMSKDGVTDALCEDCAHPSACRFHGCYRSSRASPPVSTDGLVERLRTMGCYGHKPYPTHFINPDGPEAADRIEQLTATLADRDATIERLREAVREAYREGWLVNAIPPDEHEAGADYVRGCEETDWLQSKAALDASATDHD